MSFEFNDAFSLHLYISLAFIRETRIRSLFRLGFTAHFEFT